MADRYTEILSIIDELPRVVRAAMYANGLSQNEAAKQAGLSKGHITNILDGANITVATLIRVIKWLQKVLPDDEVDAEVARGRRDRRA